MSSGLVGRSVEYLIERVERAEKRTLNALRDEAYDNAKAHGFHDVSRPVGDAMMLITTEVGEAFEAFREGSPVSEMRYAPLDESKGERVGKPIGVPSELADIVIRVLDFCGEHDIDIERVVIEKMAYNRSRPFRHGNKAL